MPIQHKNLAAGEWHKLSLAEQLGNVGSEVSRMNNWKNKDDQLYASAFERALELLGLTIQDSRWRGRLKELARARELLNDSYLGGKEYNASLEDLDSYFFNFALLARAGK